MADTYLKNMRLDNDRKADFRTENPRSAFSFLAVKIAVSRDFYSMTYPELTTATVHGPEWEEDKAVYRFKTTIGVKG